MNKSKHRILIVDDNPAIHEDFRKVLCRERRPKASLLELEALVLGGGGTESAGIAFSFELDSADQGKEAFEMVKTAANLGEPYSLAFVDMRMEPGWNGIETIQNMWSVCPDLQVVLCSAYSDYSWTEIVGTLGARENLVILRKPFENIEVLQLALALTKKWEAARELRAHLEELDHEVEVRTREAEDASERCRIEMAARSQANERFSMAFHCMPLPMAMINVQRLTWVDANDAFARLSGHSADALIAQSPEVVSFLNRQPASLLDLLRDPSRVQAASCDFLDASGTAFKILLSREFFNSENERHALLIMQDVTEQRRSEERLRVGMRMEAIGRLSIGVAHDFNNIMTVVEGHTSLLLNDANLPAEYRSSLCKIAEASQRASDVVRQLLTVERQRQAPPQLIDVAEHVRQAVSLLRRLVGEHTQIRVDSSLGLAPVMIDQGSLDQILINLVVNARDSMPNGGTIQFCIRSADVQDEDIHRARGAHDGQFIVIHVEDAGEEVDPALRRKVVEPRAMAGTRGEGGGLGLSNVRGLVEQLAGWVEVETSNVGGSRVSVYLPQHEAPVEVAPAPMASTSAQGAPRIAGRTALVVEDQGAVRTVLKKMLAQMGMRVLEADTGMNALEVWRRMKSEIAIVITDVMMPGGISGVELGRKLLSDKSTVKIIYSTGYGADSVEGVKLVQGVNYLPKPYDTKLLSAIVSQALTPEPPQATMPRLHLSPTPVFAELLSAEANLV